MKQLLAFVLLIFSYTLYAQNTAPDKIHKKDKTVVNAIVTEVSKTEIQYKKFTSPNGATFTIPTHEVSSIVYANGYIDMIDDAALAEKDTPQEAPTTVSPEASVAVAETEPEEKSSKQKERAKDKKEKAAEADSEASASSESSGANAGSADPVAKKSSRKNKKEEKKTEETASADAGSGGTEKSSATASTAPRRKSKGLSGKEVGVELPAEAFTGLDIHRVPKDQLLKDIRNPEEYAGEYQWKSSNKGGRETAWLIEWDNVTLTPKEWMGYGWRLHGSNEKGVKLKGNELRASGDVIGYFVKFEHNGKEVRGLQVKTKKDQELFLMKME